MDTNYVGSKVRTYYEQGPVCSVEVLEDNSSRFIENYKLRILENLSDGSQDRPAKVGEIFTCQKKRVNSSAIWRLE
jgi:hypothetical protein